MIGVLRLPDEIRFGWGASRSAPRIARSFGERVLVVADPFLSGTAAFSDLLDGVRVAGAEVEVVTDIPPELPVAAIEGIVRRLGGFTPDAVLGYGGGSALDAAKLVAVLLVHGGTLADYYGENRVPGPVLPLLAVPTTAGTGSEATPVAVVSDPERALKVGVSSPHLVPRVAIVDPELTVSAPPRVTAHAGIDAFVHAVESYTASALDLDPADRFPVFAGRNALSDPLSLEAARLIFRALPVAVQHPDDREARTDMARGSLLAGMAFGSTGTHLSHAIQYPVGAMTKTPHGLGTGVLLPYVLQACLPMVSDRLVDIGIAMGVLDRRPSGDGLAEAQAVVDAIAGLVSASGLPGSLRELGIRESDVPRVTELTLQVTRIVAISPVGADETMITRVIAAATTGDRSALGGIRAVRQP